MRRIDLYIGGAGVRVFVNNFLPRLAPVARTEQAAFFIWTVGMAEHSGKNTIGIARVDGKRGDLLAVSQAEVSPSLSRVSGFVNSVTNREIGAVQSFAAGDINDFGIGRSDGDCTNRLRGLVVEDGIPGAAVVVGFPDPAVDLANIKHIGLAGNSVSCARAAATKRADPFANAALDKYSRKSPAHCSTRSAR